jgi:hypothetical protein
MARMITFEGYTTDMLSVLDLIEDRRERDAEDARYNVAKQQWKRYGWRVAGVSYGPGSLACSPGEEETGCLED